MKRLLKQKVLKIVIGVMMFVFLAAGLSPVQSAFANKICGDPNGTNVETSIDLGCQSKGNPIMDLLFAIIRVLAAGVGIIVIASIIVGGIQFSTSRSDPQASASAINRIRTSLIALIIYIFAYAILNFVIPGGFFT